MVEKDKIRTIFKMTIITTVTCTFLLLITFVPSLLSAKNGAPAFYHNNYSSYINDRFLCIDSERDFKDYGCIWKKLDNPEILPSGKACKNARFVLATSALESVANQSIKVTFTIGEQTKEVFIHRKNTTISINNKTLPFKNINYAHHQNLTFVFIFSSGKSTNNKKPQSVNDELYLIDMHFSRMKGGRSVKVTNLGGPVNISFNCFKDCPIKKKTNSGFLKFLLHGTRDSIIKIDTKDGPKTFKGKLERIQIECQEIKTDKDCSNETIAIANEVDFDAIIATCDGTSHSYLKLTTPASETTNLIEERTTDTPDSEKKDDFYFYLINICNSFTILGCLFIWMIQSMFLVNFNKSIKKLQ